MPTQPYVYLISDTMTEMWYIGCRFRKGCNPNEDYWSSSKVVRAIYKQRPDTLVKTILAIGNKEEVVEFETELLNHYDAKNNPSSYNQHNGDGKFAPLYNEPWNKGLTGVQVPWNKGLKNVQVPWNKGKFGEEHHSYGKKRTPETCKNISKALKGRKTGKVPKSAFKAGQSPWNEGKTYQQRQVTCPHCNKTGGISALKRYHYDNCKYKYNDGGSVQPYNDDNVQSTQPKNYITKEK